MEYLFTTKTKQIIYLLFEKNKMSKLTIIFKLSLELTMVKFLYLLINGLENSIYFVSKPGCKFSFILTFEPMEFLFPFAIGEVTHLATDLVESICPLRAAVMSGGSLRDTESTEG